jgi:hypothetical protein
MNTRTQGFRSIVRTCSDLCRSIFVEIEQWWCKFDNFCAMEWIVERNLRTKRKETRTWWNVAHQWKRIEERHSSSDFERVIDSIRALKHVQKERKKDSTNADTLHLHQDKLNDSINQMWRSKFQLRLAVREGRRKGEGQKLFLESNALLQIHSN